MRIIPGRGAGFELKSKAETLFKALGHSTQLSEKKLLSDLAKLTFCGSKLSFPKSTINSYFVSAIADFLHESLAASKTSFAFETVMSHRRKIELLKYAKSKTFRNYLYFIATEAPEINISRVKFA